MRVEIWKSVVGIAAEHPLLASLIVLLVVLAILLGGIHELELLGKVLIVLVRDVKQRLTELGHVARNLWRELTKWKVDE